MNTQSRNIQSGAIGSLPAAKRVALRVALLYIALVGAWILLQSGIPMAMFIDYKIEPFTWTQLFVGWFFIIASARTRLSPWLTLTGNEQYVRPARRSRLRGAGSARGQGGARISIG